MRSSSEQRRAPKRLTRLAVAGLGGCLATAVGCAAKSDDAGGGAASLAAASARGGAAGLAADGSSPVAAAKVGLDGQFTAGEREGSEARVFARAARAWIYSQPSDTAEKLGYLRAGAGVAQRGAAAGYERCKAGWYPVAPRGFVCAQGTASSDERDPLVVAYRGYGPVLSRKLPYIYGIVRRPGPFYARVPTRAEAESSEAGLVERMEAWLQAEGEVGANYAQHVWLDGTAAPAPSVAWRERTSEALPAFLQRGREPSELVRGQMKPRQGLSLLKTLLFEGRRYGVTSDLQVVATDRLRPIQGSVFHGVEVGKDIDFPFAFVRREGARLKRYQKGKLIESGPAPYWATLKLTGKQTLVRGRLHYETSEGDFISDQDAARLDQVRKMPAWGKNGERWLDVNVTKQTLVAYEGTRAVFATLISTGEAGLEDPQHSTATKRGIFRIHTKHLTTTMSSDEVGEEFELRDVPYVQFFEEGYALHGAYWHDRFGTPKSHGCINLTPEDARRLFFFTEPALPAGWHGVMTPLTGTVLFIHQ